METQSCQENNIEQVKLCLSDANLCGSCRLYAQVFEHRRSANWWIQKVVRNIITLEYYEIKCKDLNLMAISCNFVRDTLN